MSDSDSYSADPARIHGGVRQIEQIRGLIQGMMRNFSNEINLTKGWPGTNDSFAENIIPQELKERVGTTNTVQALSEAILSVADGTTGNLKNILGTQDGNLDAILNSSGGGGRSGRH
ncbi:hypothetical protein ACFVFJ_49500 [Streptomyces sp. NPDC057717]|uniref:hypothetical protein n=1 Tax=Streptomyces sp. NPDC057717 TaxID=3346224 RepID=UPI003677970E